MNNDKIVDFSTFEQTNGSTINIPYINRRNENALKRTFYSVFQRKNLYKFLIALAILFVFVILFT